MPGPVKLLATLERHLAAAHSHDDLDQAVGLARGTLARLRRGTTKLRVHHVQSLGEVFGLTIIDLFWEAYGRDEGSERLTELFIRLLRPEIERLLSRSTPISSPDVLQRRFSQLPVEEP